MPNELTKVQNPDHSEYVSQLLDLMSQNVAAMGISSETAREPISNKKTSLVVEIVVGLGVAATWDLLKFAVGALGPTLPASGSDEVVLGGKRYKITEITGGGPGEADDDTGRDSG
ncbi:hypothetical protein [Nocardia sp. NPDC019255]|uniref:hypothetical protein n=1 Tax=Nocardia sp. NPDC019255 TaxID=3154591 RepID=UPI0033C6D76F